MTKKDKKKNICLCCNVRSGGIVETSRCLELLNYNFIVCYFYGISRWCFMGPGYEKYYIFSYDNAFRGINWDNAYMLLQLLHRNYRWSNPYKPVSNLIFTFSFSIELINLITNPEYYHSPQLVLILSAWRINSTKIMLINESLCMWVHACMRTQHTNDNEQFYRSSVSANFASGNLQRPHRIMYLERKDGSRLAHNVSSKTIFTSKDVKFHWDIFKYLSFPI